MCYGRPLRSVQIEGVFPVAGEMLFHGRTGHRHKGGGEIPCPGGADGGTAHTVDTFGLVGGAGGVQRNGPGRAPAGAETALDALFIALGLEGEAAHLGIGARPSLIWRMKSVN